VVLAIHNTISSTYLSFLHTADPLSYHSFNYTNTMSRYAFSTLLALTGLGSSILAQADPAVSTPLADKHFTYPDQIVSASLGVHPIDRGY
jgi:hypothetical protein